MRKLVVVALIPALAGCGGGPTVTGNSQGGVMDWFATNEREVFLLAQEHCGRYGKDARITQIVPRGGGSVTFDCVQR